MESKIIIYEPIESEEGTFSLQESEIYLNLKRNSTTKNLEFYVTFFEDLE